MEALSGASVDVSFISFDDIINDGVPEGVDVIINAGDAGTSFSGGEVWKNETLITRIREFVYNGGGFVGVGEPTAVHHQGRFFQLGDIWVLKEKWDIAFQQINTLQRIERTLYYRRY